VAICDAEIVALRSKNAIEEIAEADARFVCGLFVIPKVNGGFQPIINLKPVNKFIRHMHFKMEGLNLLRSLLRKGDYFAKVDLTDAYLTVPLCKHDRQYVQFEWGETFYQFKTLCFGLASAPWAFTKVLKPIVAYLRRSGVRLIIYLDEIFIMNDSKDRVEATCNKNFRALWLFDK